MKAIQLTAFGGPDVLRAARVPMPEPAAGQILVKIGAAGVAFAETLLRQGVPMGPLELSVILGSEITGVVSAVGPGVDVAVGTAVTAPLMEEGGLWRKGGYAEFACVDARFTIPLPADMDAAASLALLSQG